MGTIDEAVYFRRGEDSNQNEVNILMQRQLNVESLPQAEEKPSTGDIIGIATMFVLFIFIIAVGAIESKRLNTSPPSTAYDWQTATAGKNPVMQFPLTVIRILQGINIRRVEKFVTDFSSFPDRYCNSEHGVAASKCMQSLAENMIIDSNYNGNASVRSVRVKNYLMDSVVARIEGSDPTLKSEVVILGAHMDSINQDELTPEIMNGKIGGGEDDASGSAVVLEVLRVLLENNFQPKRSIEFHWYSGEKEGFVGSAEIAKDYFNRDVKVVEMLNLDRVGYSAKGKSYIYLDNEDRNEVLNSFLKLAIEKYCNIQHKIRYCGYECSDHGSWDHYGFSAVFASGCGINPHLKKVSYIAETMDFTTVMEFVKLAIAYVDELAEPK